MRLEGKVAVITGAATGLGFETARLFFNKGASIAGVYHSQFDEKKVNEVFGKAANVIFVQADITRPDDVKKIASQIEEKFGKVNILVNNAAVNSSGSIEDTSEEEFKKTMDVNVYGMFLCTKYIIPLIKRISHCNG